ncbi:hypothetical protein RIF29_20562 [Crotalaria pallida]|uniref:Uncharacterized protein n=1 Tax=Crotalaria pallida TaxID=3830 RepID=A0AAN9F1T2_CROPI
MVGEMVNGVRFSALLSGSRKKASDDKEAIGILASEVAGLMSKVVNLWHSLSDREVRSLRHWVVNSVGVKMLVSDDYYFLMELALNEILSNFESIAISVARLSKMCKDPVYRRYEHFVHNPAQSHVEWSGREYAWQKMERRVKKMERFVAAMPQLAQELEVLEELKQTLRRMKANPEFFNRVRLVEFKKKVKWQCQQVKNVKDMSPWNRSYDYIVRLLARSLFTILERIMLVFRNYHKPVQKNNYVGLSPPFSALMQSSVHPTEANIYGLYTARIGRMPTLVNTSKTKKKQHQQVFQSPSFRLNLLNSEDKQLKHIGSLKRCMSVGNESPMTQSCMQTNAGSMGLIDSHMKQIDCIKTMDKLSLFQRSRIYSKLSIKGKLRPPPCTLGEAALSLHYANVIILIEKIVLAPHLVEPQRDILYNMLPISIRTALRAKLKWYAKSKPRNSVRDANLAAEWSMILRQILEWLAPMAHNMIRWHSERNIENDHAASKQNVLLVQTLYFADQTKTEAAMVELLVGLHYVCRIERQTRMRDTPEFPHSRSFNGVRLRKNELCNKYL